MAETTGTHFQQRKFVAKTMAASITSLISFEKNMSVSHSCYDKKSAFRLRNSHVKAQGSSDASVM